MAFIELGNLKLWYDIRGQGPRVVFIPGTASDLRQHMNIFASPLIAQFEVLSFDPRGIGQSNLPDAAPTMVDYARDVHQLGLNIAKLLYAATYGYRQPRQAF